jgi:predicted P-loop ATPase
MLALAGTLRQLSLTQPEVERVVVAAAGISGDSKLEDRRTEIRTTFNRPDDDPIKGHKALTEIIGEGGKKFIAALHKIWGGRTSLFLMDAKGERILKDHIDNIAKALGLINFKAAWDSFAERITITYDGYSGTAEDKYIRRAWFAIDAKFHFRPTKELFWDVVEDIAHQNPYHPVRDYLDGLKWDGEARIDNWLVRAAQAANTPYVHAISSMLLIAAVRRVRRPGAKFDELTVLEGVQGQLKSSALRALCPYDDWFSDDLPLNVDAKQLIERTLGKWVIEASDLSGMSNTQVEHLKGMLARQVDGPVRLAYARMPIERARQFILIGSTNSHTYLTDDTGNRRFWPIRVETFDLKWIRENRDQLWAEASQREASGASIRLHKDLWEHATLQQERRRTKDPWEETITMVFQEDYQRLTPNDIWEALGVPISFRTVAQNSRLGKVLQSIGYSRKTVWKDGKAVMGWGRGQGQRAKQQELTPTSQAVVEEEM